MALKISQILTFVDSGRQDRSEYVKLTSVRYGLSKKTGFPKTVAKAYSRIKGKPSGNRYVVVVECIDNKSHVKVSCSCPDFTFRSEWHLWRKGAADIIYSNGEKPKVYLTPVCCKHLTMTFSALLFANKLDRNLEFRL